MLLEAVCPNGHRLHVPPEHAGMKLRCPACNAVFQLDGAAVAAATTASAAPAPATTAAPAATAGTVPTASTEGAGPSRWSGNEAALSPATAPANPPAAATAQQPAAQQPAASRPATVAAAQQAPAPAPQLIRRPRSWQVSMPLVLRAMVVGGLMLTATARGCDALTAKNVTRLQSEVELGQRNFEEEREQSIADAQAMVDQPNLPPAIKVERQKLLDKVHEDFDKRRRDLQQNDWRIAANDAKRAVSESRSAAYWHEWLFFLGTLLLAGGLSTTALIGQGPERWVGLALAAIVVFSLYIGGMAWSPIKL
jgi:hypothetical protein